MEASGKESFKSLSVAQGSIPYLLANHQRLKILQKIIVSSLIDD